MKRTFAFGAAAVQGHYPAQEDGYFADPVRGFFALADGFGGRGAGDMAAKIALAEASRAADWDAIFPAAAAALQKRNDARAPSLRGGCSLVVAEFEGARLSVAHTGACAAGLVRAGRWRSLLLPQISLRAPYEAPLPDEALGLPGRAARIEARWAEVVSGDILVLVSGGLDWESEAFQRALSDQLALRLPGDDLRPVAESLLASLLDLPEGPPPWNHSVVLVEKI